MKIKAFDLSRAGTGFFLTALDADQLFKLARVERVSENPAEGFQRQLDVPRARRIAKYLEERVIPGSIILSAQAESQPTYHTANGELELSDAPGSLLVIDGQHRLYGAKIAHDAGFTGIVLPVCILTNLTQTSEVQYFIDINSTAKGVPRTLRIELTKFIVKQDSIEDIRLRLFRDLNTESDSPLCGKLSAEQKGPGYLSHVPFEAALNKVLSSERMRELEYEKQKTLLKNYLIGVYSNLLSENLPQKLTQSAFFQAIFRIFDRACDAAILFRGNYKAESFIYVFEAIQRVNFDYHTGTNDEAVSALEKDLVDKFDVDKKAKMPGDLF